MTEADLVRRVTANYWFWQGLRFQPFGVFLVLEALALVAAPDALQLPIIVLGLLGALVWYRRVSRYYDRNFGYVRDLPGAHRVRSSMKWLVVYPALAISLVVDARLAMPLFVSGLVWAAGVVAYWWSTGRGRLHYLVAAGVLAVLTPLPLAGIVSPGTPMLTVLLVVTGLVYVVGGVLDHRELVRLLPPPEDVSDGSTI